LLKAVQMDSSEAKVAQIGHSVLLLPQTAVGANAAISNSQ